jgi:formate dehydrogenase major subunit
MFRLPLWSHTPVGREPFSPQTAAMVRSPRGAIVARALVTKRLKPVVAGRTVHLIGVPIHWTFAGEVVGAQANDLTALVTDPNVSMHEAKAFAGQVEAARPGGPGLVPTVPAARRPTENAVPNTPPAAQPEGRFPT